MGDIEDKIFLKEINKRFNSNNPMINQAIDDCNTQSINKYNVKLEDGISLSLIKYSSTVRIKKFFHVPNFEIYSIKEVPMNSKFFISNFKEKLSYWVNKIGKSDKFVKVYNEYVNCPEG
jgi:hypothetical protein